jgi:predicted transcriptional regulator
MPTIDQIKSEIFLSMFKRVHGPVINDVVVIGIVRAGLTKKYQYHLDTDEFNTIGDELAEESLFRWNDNGQLALTAKGLEYLTRLKSSGR